MIPILVHRSRASISTLSLSLLDRDSQPLDFHAPTAFITDALASAPHHTVLVHCAMGVSRSASLVSLSLSLSHLVFAPPPASAPDLEA